MKSMAPIYVKCLDLTGWLLDRADGFVGASSAQLLQQRVQTHAIELLETIALALQFRVGRAGRLEHANALVMRLRIELRLVDRAKLLEPRQLQYAHQCLDEVGASVGGWLRTERPRVQGGVMPPLQGSEGETSY